MARECVKMENKRWLHYEASFKHNMILSAEAEGNWAASYALGIPETCVHDWTKQRDRIFNCKAPWKGCSSPQHGQLPALEDLPADYIKELLTNHLLVTLSVIMLKALELARGSAIYWGIIFKPAGAGSHISWKGKHSRLAANKSKTSRLLWRKVDCIPALPLSTFTALTTTRSDRLLANAYETPIFLDMPSNYTVKTASRSAYSCPGIKQKTKKQRQWCCATWQVDTNWVRIHWAYFCWSQCLQLTFFMHYNIHMF